MLLMLTPTILQAPIQLHSPTLTRIVKPRSNTMQLRNFLQILLLQHTLRRAQILLGAVQMRRLRDHRSPARHAPGEHDLGRGARAFGGDFRDDGVVEDGGDVARVVGGVGPGEGRVGCYVNVVFCVPGNPGGLLEVGVESGRC